MWEEIYKNRDHGREKVSILFFLHKSLQICKDSMQLILRFVLSFVLLVSLTLYAVCYVWLEFLVRCMSKKAGDLWKDPGWIVSTAFIVVALFVLYLWVIL